MKMQNILRPANTIVLLQPCAYMAVCLDRHLIGLQVASFCGTLEKDLSDRRKTAEIDIAEILTASYASMFNTEAERRIKGVPTAFYQRAPTKLFDANCLADFPGWV